MKKKKVNIADIVELSEASPSGKYEAYGKQISEALGREPSATEPLKRHPFDVELARIPPGKILCPYHSHSAQWELYIIVSGKGTARTEEGMMELIPGDSFVFPPGEAHQIINSGSVDLIYYVIADNPVNETCYYPDSKKWAIPHGKGKVIIKGEEVGYFSGEE